MRDVGKAGQEEGRSVPKPAFPTSMSITLMFDPENEVEQRDGSWDVDAVLEYVSADLLVGSPA
jgi:hypothetical protein